MISCTSRSRTGHAENPAVDVRKFIAERGLTEDAACNFVTKCSANLICGLLDVVPERLIPLARSLGYMQRAPSACDFC